MPQHPYQFRTGGNIPPASTWPRTAPLTQPAPQIPLEGARVAPSLRTAIADAPGRAINWALRGLGDVAVAMDTGFGGLRNSMRQASSQHPYSRGLARQAAGVTSQVESDIPLSRPPITTGIESPSEDTNRRADAINAQANSDYFADTFQYPESSPVQGLQQAGPMGRESSKPLPQSTPAEAMATWTSAPTTANAPLDLAKLLYARQREFETRQINNPSSQNEGFLAQVDRDIAENPDFGEAAHARHVWIGEANLAANMGGFRTPQEAVQAALQAETYKQDAPVRAQQAAGQSDIEQQRIANQGALDVERERSGGATNFLNMMQQIRQGDPSGQNIRSINPRTGAMSFGAPQQPNTAITRDVTNARQLLAQAQQEGSDDQIAISENQLQAAISTALSRFPADPATKQMIFDVIRDPASRGHSIDDLFDLTDATPDERRSLMEFEMLIGGF